MFFPRKQTQFLLIALIAFTAVFALGETAHAVTIVPSCATGDGVPDLGCVLQTFANVARLILGVTGSFALLMFVYGGFEMLRSGGNPEGVTKGKTILRNAVIGIFIIFTSGYVLEYGMDQLGSKSGGSGSGAAEVILLDPPGGAQSCEADVANYTCRAPRDGESCYKNLCGANNSLRCCPSTGAGEPGLLSE